MVLNRSDARPRRGVAAQDDSEKIELARSTFEKLLPIFVFKTQPAWKRRSRLRRERYGSRNEDGSGRRITLRMQMDLGVDVFATGLFAFKMEALRCIRDRSRRRSAVRNIGVIHSCD